jgi:hypothetical protein
MTTRSPSPRAHAPHIIARRGTTLLVAAVLIGAAPFVAHALGDEPATDPTPRSESPVPVLGAPLDSATPPTDRGRKLVGQPPVQEEPSEFEPVPERDPEPVSEPVSEPVPEAAPPADPEAAPPADPIPEPVVDPAVLVLAGTYEWDEQGPRIEALQQILGVAADGWYGQETARAHRAALEFAELATDDLPVPVLPPGPSAGEWAALRDCEAGGDYSITNPSGKYRGAYQFDQSTWNSVAERHAPQLVGADPAATSPADQDAMALALYSERGANPWPQCGRHLR